MHAVLYRKNDPQIPLPVDVFQQEFSTKRGQAETARFREEIRRDKKSARRKMRSYPQTVQQLWITQTVRCSIWSKRFYAAPEERKRRRECAGLMKMRCLDDSLEK